MFDMFNFLNMTYNYEERKVDRYEEGNLTIDTCLITDDDEYNYETAIKHPFYNNGNWVIVEQYYTKEEAQNGHNKWVETFKNGLPQTLPYKTAGNFAKAFLEEQTIIRNS